MKNAAKNKLVLKRTLLTVMLFVLFMLPMTSTAQAAAITLDIIEKWIENIAQFMLTVGVIIAVIFIVWGAIRYMFAQGGDTGDAKKTIWNGIIGAAVILGIGVILETVKYFIEKGVEFN